MPSCRADYSTGLIPPVPVCSNEGLGSLQVPWQKVLIKSKGKSINYPITCCELAGGCRQILAQMQIM